MNYYFKSLQIIKKIKKFHTFGGLCYPWLKTDNPIKMQLESKQCIFIGYASHQSAFKCLDVSISRIFVSRNVRFFDNIFPFKELVKSQEKPPTIPSQIGNLTDVIFLPMKSLTLEPFNRKLSTDDSTQGINLSKSLIFTQSPSSFSCSSSNQQTSTMQPIHIPLQTNVSYTTASQPLDQKSIPSPTSLEITLTK